MLPASPQMPKSLIIDGSSSVRVLALLPVSCAADWPSPGVVDLALTALLPPVDATELVVRLLEEPRGFPESCGLESPARERLLLLVVNAVLDVPALATLRVSSTSSTSVFVVDQALRAMFTLGFLSFSSPHSQLSSCDKSPWVVFAGGI
jgi:hypothetical protein